MTLCCRSLTLCTRRWPLTTRWLRSQIRSLHMNVQNVILFLSICRHSGGIALLNMAEDQAWYVHYRHNLSLTLQLVPDAIWNSALGTDSIITCVSFVWQICRRLTKWSIAYEFKSSFNLQGPIRLQHFVSMLRSWCTSCITVPFAASFIWLTLVWWDTGMMITLQHTEIIYLLFSTTVTMWSCPILVSSAQLLLHNIIDASFGDN